jgi:nucleoside phosphorylase
LIASAVADLTRRFPEVVAADWESASIARVARRRQTRLLILRAASDLVSEKHGEAAGNLPLFQNNAAALMRLLLDDLRAIVPYVLPRLSAAATAE